MLNPGLHIGLDLAQRLEAARHRAGGLRPQASRLRNRRQFRPQSTTEWRIRWSDPLVFGEEVVPEQEVPSSGSSSPGVPWTSGATGDSPRAPQPQEDSDRDPWWRSGGGNKEANWDSWSNAWAAQSDGWRSWSSTPTNQNWNWRDREAGNQDYSWTSDRYQQNEPPRQRENCAESEPPQSKIGAIIGDIPAPVGRVGSWPARQNTNFGDTPSRDSWRQDPPRTEWGPRPPVRMAWGPQQLPPQRGEKSFGKKKKDWGHPDGLSILELQVGCCVGGDVTNVTVDGAFVNIGAQKDGLLPASQFPNLSKRPCKGDCIDNLVICKIDTQRNRISLQVAGAGFYRQGFNNQYPWDSRFPRHKDPQVMPLRPSEIRRGPAFQAQAFGVPTPYNLQRVRMAPSQSGADGGTGGTRGSRD